MKMIHMTIRFTKSSLIFVSVAIFGVLFSACRGNHNGPEEKPVVENNQSQYETIVEFGADIVVDEPAAKGPHRVHLGENHISSTSDRTDLLWTADDEVACWNAEERKWAPYRLVSGANTTAARFQGKAVHENDDKNFEPAMNISHAIFPKDATVRETVSDGKGGTTENLISPGDMMHSIYFTMPDEQKYQAPMPDKKGIMNPTFGSQYNVMTGTRSDADKNHLNFTSTGGVLLLRIKGSSFLPRVYKMKLTSNKDEHLWGTFTAAIGAYGASTVEEASDINGELLSKYGCQAGNNSLILDCSAYFGANQLLPTDDFANFYFVVPANVFSEGFTIELDTDGDGAFNNATIVTRKDNTMRQGNIRVMPALEMSENVTLTWDLDDLYNQGTVTEF